MKLEKSGPVECNMSMRMNSTRWGAPVAMELRRLLLWAAWQVHPVIKKNTQKKQKKTCILRCMFISENHGVDGAPQRWYIVYMEYITCIAHVVL